MKVHYQAHLESMGKTWKNVSLKYLKHWIISTARSLASTLSLTCDLYFILVCLHSPARLLPYPQPSRKEHAKSWRKFLWDNCKYADRATQIKDETISSFEQSEVLNQSSGTLSFYFIGFQWSASQRWSHASIPADFPSFSATSTCVAARTAAVPLVYADFPIFHYLLGFI